MRCKANISPRKRNKPTRPDLRRTEDLAGLRLKSLTMRICLGISQYDPLGLASPLFIRLKVAMKLLHQAQLGWGNDLPTDLKDQW